MKQLYLQTNELGQTYLHFVAAQNNLPELVEFFNAVSRGEASISALRRTDPKGLDPITMAAVTGNWNIVDFVIHKLKSLPQHAIPEIVKAPTLGNGKTVLQITFEGMDAGNVVLEKFGMREEKLSTIASRLEKLDSKLNKLLTCLESKSPLSKSAPADLESTAIGQVISRSNSSSPASFVTVEDALSLACKSLESTLNTSKGYRLF